MFSLASLLNKIQQRFTYRQRFLFFAAIFFLATPAPTYWVLVTEKALISQKKHELNALKQYDLLARLLYLRTIVGTQNKENQLSNAQDIFLQEMLTHLSEIEKYSESKEHISSNPLAMGFYLTIPTKPILIGIKTLLQEYFAIISSGAMANEARHLEEKLLREMNFFAVSMGMLSDPSLPYPSFLYLTFIQLPAKFLSYVTASEYNIKIAVAEYEKISLRYPSTRLWVQKALSIINNLPSLPSEKQPQAFESLRTANMHIIQRMITNQLDNLLWSYYGFIFLLIIVTVAVVIFVAIKVLTRHLLELLSHVEALAKGDFSTRYYPHSTDEFSQVGLTLNEMANALSDISGRIHSLGIVLTASSEHLTYEVMTHETSVLDQESSVHNTQDIANKITADSHKYVKIINDLSNRAMRLPLMQKTQKTLTSLYETIEEISNDSKETLTALHDIESFLAQAYISSEHMTKISEEAHSLALNASIEANSSCGRQQPFLKITQAIQQFAQRTSQATLHIISILKETSLHIDKASATITECLDELDIGRQGVNSIHSQLQGIDQQAVLQIEKFEQLNSAIKKQAFEAESIIDAIAHIRENAQTITQIFQQLHTKVQQLGSAARELRHLLEVFFSEPSNRMEFEKK